jgi:hypothetical protein
VIVLLDLLKQQKIKPLIAQRFPLVEARHAHELLGKGGVTGKIVLVRNGSSLESAAAQQRSSGRRFAPPLMPSVGRRRAHTRCRLCGVCCND